MLHTIVPMDQIFPAEPGSPGGQPESPGGRPESPGGRPGGSGDIAGPGGYGGFGGISLTARAAMGGAMARLDYQTAAGKVFPC